MCGRPYSLLHYNDWLGILYAPTLYAYSGACGRLSPALTLPNLSWSLLCWKAWLSV
jgi:hypothetical protein